MKRNYRKQQRTFRYRPRKWHLNKKRFCLVVVFPLLLVIAIVIWLTNNTSAEQVATTEPIVTEQPTSEPMAVEQPTPIVVEEIVVESMTIINEPIATAEPTPNPEKLKSEAVKAIQQALVNAGFKISVDGIIGPKTDSAIMAFQEANGLYADGIVGEKTAKALGLHDLNFELQSSYRYLDGLANDTSWFSSKTSWLIYVDQSEFTITVYHKVDGEWEAYKTALCAVGKRGKTPTGTFEIGQKHSGFEKSGKYYYYFTSFDGSYGFHSVPYENGRVENGTLGKAISAGCIRLSKANAEWLQDTVPAGSTVVIVK